VGARIEQVKGQGKETVGAITGDKDLEVEGKTDRRAGQAKESLDHAKVKLEEAIDKAGDTGAEAIDKAKDSLHRR